MTQKGAAASQGCMGIPPTTKQRWAASTCTQQSTSCLCCLKGYVTRDRAKGHGSLAVKVTLYMLPFLCA